MGVHNDRTKTEVIPYFDGEKPVKKEMVVYHRKDCNKYDRISMPSHPRARKDGMIEVHIVMAEYLMGRYLKPNEVVHHIDHIKHHNDLQNLMVFESDRYHRAYHNGAKLIKNNDGTFKSDIPEPREYILSEESYSKRLYKCEKCGQFCVADRRCKVCAKCAAAAKSKIPSKDELEEVVSKNRRIDYASISKIYGVSANSISKWCKNTG